MAGLVVAWCSEGSAARSSGTRSRACAKEGSAAAVRLVGRRAAHQ